MTIANIGQTLLKYGIKAAGVAGIGIALYDAHKQGVYRSKIEVNKGNANAALDWFDNSRNMVEPSHFNSKMKDGLFRFELHNNLRAFVNAGIGYIKGGMQMIFNDLLPIGLSVGALATKGGSKSSYVAGGALGLYALYGFAKNVLGFGVSQDNGSDKAI